MAARWAEFRRRPITSTYRSLVATAAAVFAESAAVAAATGTDPQEVAEQAREVLRQRTAADPVYVSQLVEVLLGDGLAGEAWQAGVRYREQLGPRGWLEVLAVRAETHPQEVVEPVPQALIGERLVDSYDARRYDRALDILTRLQRAQAAAGGSAGFDRYVEELRVQHRIRPAFLRKLDAPCVRAGRPS